MDFFEFKSKIEKIFLDKLALTLDNVQCQAFFDFMNMLISKNEVMNLTAITEPDEVIMKHFLDSCMILKFVKNFNCKNIIDVGTGAGFPGVPLAIVCKNADFVLTDTLGKRINFLNEVKDAIGLNNVKLIKARAEDLAHDLKYREKFDIVLSRGVAKVPVLSEYSLPFVKNGGKMFAYKMDNCDDEINDGKNALKILGGMFHVKHSYEIYSNEPQRCILEILKEKNTPKMYPRKAGTPSKNPL